MLLKAPGALKRVDIYDILMACPQMGPDRTRQACERAHVWPHVKLGEMTKIQRMFLEKELPERVK